MSFLDIDVGRIRRGIRLYLPNGGVEAINMQLANVKGF